MSSLPPTETLIDDIHDMSINDAVKVAKIAQNMFALGAGFFQCIYDHLILSNMVKGPFTDITGAQREIYIHDRITAPRVDGRTLYLPRNLWENMSVKNEEVKALIGRYLLNLPLSTTSNAAIDLRTRTEFTAFSDKLNAEYYQYNESVLHAFSAQMVDIPLTYLLSFCPHFCTRAHREKMYEYAYNMVLIALDSPSDMPLIRAFNEAVPAALFLDVRGAEILRIFRSLQIATRNNPELQETFPLDYMAHCMTLVAH